MRNRIRKEIYKLLKGDGVVTLLMLIVFLIVYIFNLSVGNTGIVNWDFLWSLIFVAGATAMAKIIVKNVLVYFEDENKLTTDYDSLVSKYPRVEWFVYNNRDKDAKAKIVMKHRRNIKRLIKKYGVCSDKAWKTKFPIICEHIFQSGENNIIVIDSHKMYELPQDINNKFASIMEAHKLSDKYNYLNVRVDDWKNEHNEFKIYTSRTTYFKGLVTNKAMDYVLDDGTTIRQMYQYGPFFPSLKKSNMSNHLGFNVYVELEDGILFVKRNSTLINDKKIYGAAVGAVLKIRDLCVSEEDRLSYDLIKTAVKKSMLDELPFGEEYVESLDYTGLFMAAYRDVTEGGKPQLAFYVKAKNKYLIDIKKDYREKIKQYPYWQRKGNDKLGDGSKFIVINKMDLAKAVILPDVIMYKESSGRRFKKYKMHPSVAFGAAILVEYLKL